MKIPQIESQIKLQEKRTIKFGAFLGLGAGAIATTIEPAFALIIPFVAAYVISDVVGIELFLNDHKKDKWFTSKQFNKKLNNWFENYIKDSENFTEKKYKAIFLSLWFKHKEFDSNDLTDLKLTILNVAEDLMANKETVYYLGDVFKDNLPLALQITKKEVNLEKFLEEDKKNPEKIDIAKKVYEEFSHMGLAAKLFVTGKDFSQLLYLQNYKFNTDDYELIKQFTKELKENKKGAYSVIYLNPYSQNTIEAIYQLVNYENDINNLKILKNYCYELEERGYAKNMEHAEIMKKSIVNKIDYLDMNKELVKKDFQPIKPRKI